MKQMLMSQLAVQIRGVSYRPHDLHDGLDSSSVVLLRANNIDDGTINFDDVVYVDRSRVSSNQLLKKGDILICASSGSKNLVGKAAQVDFKGDVTFGAFCKVVRPVSIDEDYLGMYFQSPSYRSTVAALARGANINNIKNEDIDNLMVNVTNNDECKDTVLTLKKILLVMRSRQRQLQKLDELVKARFVELFGNCENMVSMNDLCLIITDGTHQPPKFQNSGIPFIFVSNLVDNAVTYDAEKFISEETYSELYKRTPIEIGDLLLSTVGSYGHPAVVTEDRKFLFQRHIAYIKPNHHIVNSFYLHSALLAPDGQRQIEEKVKGIAQKTLNLSEIRKIMIPIPPIIQQNEFEQFIKQSDKSKVAVQRNLIQNADVDV